MKIRYPKFLIIIGCLIHFAIGNVVAQEITSDSTLHYGTTRPMGNLNPLRNEGNIAALNMLFEPLVINTDEGIKPWLAESWIISPDGKQYDFYLRQNVVFSDGSPFDAQAVKDNIDMVLRSATPQRGLALPQLIDQVQVIAPLHVRILLKEVYVPTLIELSLAHPFRFISPRDLLIHNTKSHLNSQSYAGTGPWLLDSMQKKQAVFIVNPRYWGKKPELQRIEWRTYESSEALAQAVVQDKEQLVFGSDTESLLDSDTVDTWLQSQKLVLATDVPGAVRALIINSQHPDLQDLRIRKALQHAIDKQSINDDLFHGKETIAETLFPDTLPDSDITLPTYSFSQYKANSLLNQSGWIWPKGKNYREKEGKVLQFTLVYNKAKEREREMAPMLQNDLKKIGIDLKLVGEEESAYLMRQKKGNFDLIFTQSAGRAEDPYAYLLGALSVDSASYQALKGLNEQNDINSLINQVIHSMDDDERADLYAEVLMLLADNAVYIPLTYRSTKALFVPALKGVSFNLSPSEIPFERMSFSTEK